MLSKVLKFLALSILWLGFFYPAVQAEAKLVSVQPSSREVTITGFSRARANMVLSSEVDGKIETVYADIGDRIPKDGLFTCLDDTFIVIDIESAENDIQQHQADIKYYKKQVSRYKQLVEKNSASKSLLDDFQRQLSNSSSLKQKMTLQKQRLLESKKRHCIGAPSGWSVVERFVEPGQWIQSGTQVAKISDYSSLLVPLALSVHELKALERNKSNLTVNLSNYNKKIPATIERISPAFDEQSHKIRVDLSLKKGLPIRRGGVRVELMLDLPDHFGAWLIDRKAVDERFEEAWVEHSDGKKLQVRLLGYTNNGKARITSAEIKATDKFKLLH